MEIIRLTLEDCHLLATRFAEYGNSHLRFEEAIAAMDQPDATLARLRALRRRECHFSIDLGTLYHRYQHRDDPGLHPLERSILDSIARWHHDLEGQAELWVLVDYVRLVRELIDEKHTERFEPASNG